MKVLEDVAVMTWDRFKEIFRNKYFIAPVRAMKLNEFIQLKQGSMTVTEYINKFEHLSLFAAHMVGTDVLKAGRFLDGLKPELYRDVCMAGIQGVTYAQIVERALVAEQAENRIMQAQDFRKQIAQRQGQRWPGNDRSRAPPNIRPGQQ